MGSDEWRDVGSRVEGTTQAPECRVVVGQVPSPPFFERGRLREPEPPTVHRQGSNHPRGPAVAIPERVSGREGRVDPSGGDGGMLAPFLHGRTCGVDEARYRLRGRRLKHGLPAATVHDVGGAGAESPRPRPPVPGEHSIVQPDQQLAVPLEGNVVRAPQDEAHGVGVAPDECGVLLSGLGRAVPGEDPVNILEGDGHAFHRCGCGDRLGFAIAPQTTRPGSRDRAPVVELGPPAIQLLQLRLDGRRSVSQEHEWFLSLIN